MQQNLTALERAFELANSGSCESVADIKKTLKSEGYSDQQITGRALGKQLTELIQQARVRGNTL
jgi:HEAT repeat protein